LKNAVNQVMQQKGFLGLECNVSHIRFADPVAKNWFNNNNKSSDFESLETSCIKSIYENCSKDLPLFLLVHDKKNQSVIDLAKDYNIVYIESNEYDQKLPDICKNGRDIISICDIIACYNLKVNNLIYQENKNDVSSFSLFLKNTLNFKNSFNY
jgi:hypothetical protein